MSDELYDGMFDGIMKSFLAQLNSSLQISKILSEHCGEDELSEDSIISGLVYRLMTPMGEGDIKESIEIADEIYNKIFYSESESESESDSESYDEEEDTNPKELTLRKVKTNNCNCEICIQTRVCLINYKNHEPKDELQMIYKNAIESACSKGKLYI